MVIPVALLLTLSSIWQFLIGINTMYWLASILTLCAMVPSWIGEHESDKVALEKAGLASTISALIKVHVYGTLKSTGLFEVIDECLIKHKESLQDVREKACSFAAMFRILLKYSLAFPKSIIEYIRRPAYYTHPPLQLRIGCLLNHARSEWYSHVSRATAVEVFPG